MVAPGLQGCLLLALAALALPLASSGAEPVVQGYIAGTHTITGQASNVPVAGSVPLSTAFAVCQQHVEPSFFAFKADTPGFGGACSLPLPSDRVSITVADALKGAIEFEYSPVNLTGAACGPLGAAPSGTILEFAPNCIFVYVWPHITATYGNIIVAPA